MTVPTLLDCTAITDNHVDFVYDGSPENEISRIRVYRLEGTVTLKNLQNVDTIDIRVGYSTCSQVLEHHSPVTLQQTDGPLVCSSNDVTNNINHPTPTTYRKQITVDNHYSLTSTPKQNPPASSTPKLNPPTVSTPKLNPPASSTKAYIIIIIVLVILVIISAIIILLVIHKRRMQRRESIENMELSSIHAPSMELSRSPVIPPTNTASSSILMESNESIDSVVELFTFKPHHQVSLYSSGAKQD
ncbi:hypothetical protein ACF0H5_016002 [Mactra antiquata]